MNLNRRRRRFLRADRYASRVMKLGALEGRVHQRRYWALTDLMDARARARYGRCYDLRRIWSTKGMTF